MTRSTIQKYLFRIFSIFMIGIIVRYLINEYINISSILEYSDCISILFSCIISSLFIEPYVDYDIYDYNLDKSEVKKYNLDHYITNLASQQNPNNPWETNPPRIIPRSSMNQAPPQNSLSISHYYDESGVPFRNRTPWVASHSNGSSHYHLDSGRISIRTGSNIENYNFDFVTKRKLMDAINYDIIYSPTYIEFPVDTMAPNGIVSLGIKHYGDPSDPVAFYIKYFDLVNTEHVWDIWKKDVRGDKFKYLWLGEEKKIPRPAVNPKLKMWQEIDKITEVDTAWKNK